MNFNQTVKQYPLSSPQREIWFDQMLHPDAPLYNIGGYIEINGYINPTIFESAVNLSVQGHDVLRTVLVSGESELPMQSFLEEIQILVPFNDFSGQHNPKQSAWEWMEDQFVKPFELNGGNSDHTPLFRFALLKVSENHFNFFFVYHHLIIDGWGISLINGNLGEIYSALKSGNPSNFEAPSYSHFIEYDQLYYKSSRYDRDLQYWMEKYKTTPEPLLRPLYSSKFVEGTPPSDWLVESFPRSFYNRMISLAESCNVSTFHLILGALYVCITRTWQNEELAVGLPILNRPKATFKNTVGVFVSFSAVLFDFGTRLSFKELLLEIGKELGQTYRRQRLPISDLNRKLGLTQNGRKQLFDVGLSYEKHDNNIFFGPYSGRVKPLEHGYEQTPLMIHVREFHHEEDVEIDFVFNLAYFDSDEIKRIHSRFMLTLEYVLNHAEESIGTIPLVTEEEKQQLLAWNQTEMPYPKDRTIVDLFHARVEQSPDNIAAVFDEQELSYGELNRKANQLAHYLIGLGTRFNNPETLMGICVERSLDMLIGLLAILKVGGAYLPLDPDYPEERLKFMLKDSGAKVLLSQNHLLERLTVKTEGASPSSCPDAQVVCLDGDWEQIAACSCANPPGQSGPDNSAYVIYTSGSTGKPKGVKIEHGAFVNFLSFMKQRIGITSNDKLLAPTTLSFDIAALELYLPLIAGGQTIIISREIAANGEILSQKLSSYQITIMQATPATWKLLIHSGWHQLTPLTILCGGEALQRQLGQTLLNNSQQLWNVYGPTETTIWSSIHNVTQHPENPEWIGKPIGNTKIHILDKNDNSTPPGVPGELCIAGKGLARGYLNRPELTAEKFVEIELWGQKQRVYKTGDLGRWLPDGNIECLGRQDHQVKIRGFRIELGEIEAAICLDHGVKEALVTLYNKDDNPRLIAYLTLRNEDLAIKSDGQLIADHNLLITELRTRLKTRLPDYMLPTAFTVMDKLPLTPNGKINRKALPEPDFANQPIQSNKQVKKPRTEMERLLCLLWSRGLGIEVTSILCNFFEEGGHSLIATQIVSRIGADFGIKMSLRTFFDTPILKDQAQWLEKQQRGSDFPQIIPLAEGDRLVLSFAQQRLWFLAQLEGESANYNMPATLHLSGQLDETALKHVLVTIVERHESLRLCFPVVKGEATIKCNDVYNPLSISDLSGLSETERESQVKERIVKHANTPFDLRTGPLLSLQLLKLGPEEHILLFNMHHIISDGWSIGVLIREWSTLYNAHATNGSPQLPVLPTLEIQYTDYASWQRNWLEEGVLESQLSYWKEKLVGATELLELPTDYPRPATMRYQGKHLKSTLDQDVTYGIKEISRQQGVTVFMTLLAAFNVLLYRYSGQTDLAVGSPIANRTQRQTEDLIGFFVNTLVLRNQINGEQAFPELLKQVRQTSLEAYGNQDIPFEYLVEKVNPSRSLSHSPLFQVMFVMGNATTQIENELKLGDLKVSLKEPDNRTAKFDLTLSIAEDGKEYVCDWEYNTDLFGPDTIARMTAHFDILLKEIIKKPEQPLSQLPLLTEEEQQQLQDWNQTETAYPKDKTIIDLFQEQVLKTPDNIAVAFEERQLTYKQLNQKANQLAHYLLSLKSDRDNRLLITDNCSVGICMKRSLDMVIGLLGILKAGGAYLPLDPGYPASRLEFMWEDSSVPVLLSQSHLMSKIPESTGQVVYLDRQWNNIAAFSTENPVRQSGPNNLAYILFTSGSTGKPKGVMIDHKSATRLIQWARDTWSKEHLACVLASTSINFDLSVYELFVPLCVGGKLFLVDNALSLATLPPSSAITLINTVPSAIAELSRIKGIPNSVKVVNLAGEPLKNSLVQTLFEQETIEKIYNLYGPSEDTTYSTFSLVPKGSDKEVNIGGPIADTKIYILDSCCNPAPAGVPGELCIAGAGLAWGYLNRPELTAETFIELEIFDEKQRFYKTGDLARWVPANDGTACNLEYLGRLDHQVKLRGFRIELSEIEVALSQHEAVKEAVVKLYNKEDNPCLAAYVTVKNEKSGIKKVETPLTRCPGRQLTRCPCRQLSEDVSLTTELRTWLKTRLPEYMLPTSFTVLEKLPLTLNGKIDRKALPAPDLVGQVKQEAPRTETEHLLCSLWSQTLGIEITSIQSNFFESGGHSLLATRLVSRIRDSFGVETPLRIIFEQTLLRQQAEWLDKQESGPKLPPITPLLESEPLVLSFAQQRLWFLEQLDGQSATYNISAALELSGLLNETALQQALIALVQRHEVLRLCFPAVKGKATVRLNEAYNPLSIVDLCEFSEMEQQKRVKEWITNHAQTPFDLAVGPLMSLRLLKLGKQKQILLFNMHHIISDGWSIGVLIREWSQLYGAYAQNQEPQLLNLPIQYTDYAAWQKNWLQGGVLEQQLSFWINKLTGEPELPKLLELPTDYQRPAVMSYKGKCLQRTLDKELYQKVKRLSRKQNATVFMTLLAAFKVLLFRYSGQTDLVVGSPIANRTHRQTEDLIGFFVNTLVLRTQIKGKQSFQEFLKQVKQTALEAYSHQDIPFEYLVEQVNPDRSLSYSPLFQVMFTLQNPVEEELKLSGLTTSFLEPENRTAKFDLSLRVEEQGEVFVCHWEYRTDLFRPDTVARMTEHFQILLEGILNYPDQSLSLLPLLTEKEQQQLQDWNGTETAFSKDNTIIDLFQEQVAKTPDKVAVAFEERQLTYKQLNQKVNQLSNYLLSLKSDRDNRLLITDNCLVGICMERSLDMVIGLLGILKAGGAYVPLDPGYPESRLQFMLEDSSVPVLLSQSHLTSKIPVSTGQVVCLDKQWNKIAAASTKNPARQSGPNNLAYVLFTSGSTGKPKGVMIDHKSAATLIQWARDTWSKEHLACVLASTSINFDLSVYELFAPLCSGGKLFLVENALSLATLPPSSAITLINTVPSAIAELSRIKGIPNSVKVVNLAGEPLKNSLVQTLFEQETIEKVYNLYGPSEDTTYSTFSLIPKGSDREVNIGVPIADTKIYILDSYHKPTPAGVPGELCIAGAGLARGYLNRPELTAEKFIEIEIFGEKQRFYKTGDLARLVPANDGNDYNLEYLCRLDYQVKIRGFRIELGEIEVTLTKHPNVQEAAVIVKNNRLLAYIVSQSYNESLDGAEEWQTIGNQLRDNLKHTLPAYMIPSALIPLERMPLMPNGKINRMALIQLSINKYALRREFIPPQTTIERGIAEVWQNVLKLERVGIHDNFFDLGGHSLLASQVISRIGEKYQIEITLRNLFKQPTLAELANLVMDHDKEMSMAIGITPRGDDEELALSFAQERLWFLDQLIPDNPFYNMPGAFMVSGDLNVLALERTFHEIFRRHEALRTNFISKDGRPIQIITPELDYKLPLTDLTGLSLHDQDEQVRLLTNEEAMGVFDLSSDPLLRVALLKLSEKSYVLLVTMHHIVSDGWSMGVMTQEVSALYEAFSRDEASPLIDLEIQYGDFAIWQRKWLAGDVVENQLNYWKNHLANLPTLELLLDRSRPKIASYRGGIKSFEIPGDVTRRLRDLGNQEGATLYMTLLSIFAILMSRYSGQDDIVIGSPIANRNRKEIENLIGFFVNTLVMRCDLSGEPGFLELLSRIKNVAMDSFENQDLPLEQLVEELQPERDMSRNPLVQVSFALQNMPMSEVKLPGLTLSPLDMETVMVRFDMEVHIWEDGEGLKGQVLFNTDLFEQGSIQRMILHYRNLCEEITNDPLKSVSQIAMISESERDQLVVQWNDTKSEYPSDKCIHELFEQQTEKTPESIAVVFEDKRLTYRELNERANHLAHYLHDQFNIKPDDLVGIVLEPSEIMIITLMGILKSGGAYVPLDPSHPENRLNSIIEDSGTKLVIKNEELGIKNCEIINIDSQWDEIVKSSSIINAPLLTLNSNNLAYAIFTSGSTGRPKGVEIEHHSVLNLVYSLRESIYKKYDNPTNVALLASYVFDASVQQIFPALLLGHSLVLVREEVKRDSALMTPFFREHDIEVTDCTPSLFSIMLNGDTNGLPLKHIIIGGETLPVDLVADCYKKMNASGEIELINIYGPTECCVDSTIYHVNPGTIENIATVPIGKPLSNTQIYILDHVGRLTSVGIRGEIYIGGHGLARGYVNNPGLTDEKFVPSPFAPHERLYKTGDLGRWLPDGNIEFFGRIDHQVKIRGYRVELGEIEAHIRQEDSVKEAVVILREDVPGDKRLTGYVAFEPHDLTSLHLSQLVEKIKGNLKLGLPEYMVPAALVYLESFPLTSRGKVDRKSLPIPEIHLAGDNYTAPENPVQEYLVELWSDLLRIKNVGIHDSFFDLGGHSLLATQAISRIRQEYEIEIPLGSLFESPTPAGLGKIILGFENGPGHIERIRAMKIGPRVEDEELVLSFAQVRLCFLIELIPDNPFYNIPVALRLAGNLDVLALEKTFSEIFKRHEVLRTNYITNDGGTVQVIVREFEYKLVLIDLTGLFPHDREEQVRNFTNKEAMGVFDFTGDPLLRVKLLKISEEDYVLLVTIHHIVSDGWSMNILTREVCALYEAFSKDEESPLPELEIQYADFSLWQRKWLRGEILENQLNYWKNQLAELPTLELPLDRPRPKIASYSGGIEYLEIPGDVAKKLKDLGNREGATLYMTLLAIFSILMSRYSGQEDIVLGSPIANRNRKEIEDLIGFFVNTLVMRCNLSGDPGFAELLLRVKGVTMDAFENQDLPFEQIVEELQPERDMSRNPLVQVSFALQNTPMSEIKLPGLTLTTIEMEAVIARFDMDVHIWEVGEGLKGQVLYNTDLFEQGTIQRMIFHYRSIIEEITNDPFKSVSQIAMISESERAQLVVEWNNTKKEYPTETCIHEMFEQQVEKTPEADAVVFEDKRLTYRELNNYANNLAHLLIELGVSTETLVGISIERSIDMPAGLLGILKAGGAYVPLDPEYPEDRLNFMIEDSKLEVLLTKGDHGFRDIKAEILNIDHVQITDKENPDNRVGPENLVYVIYTSGSTGRPKGVEVLHRGLTNFLNSMKSEPGITRDDVLLSVTTISFDISALELYLPLMVGAGVVIASRESALDPLKIRELVIKNNVTIMQATPATWGMIADQWPSRLNDGYNPKILCGGEALSHQLLEKLLTLRTSVWNLYGPTETTIWSTLKEIKGLDDISGSAPIGYPIGNTEIYILDKRLEPVPIGVSGELYIGGMGLARGYRNRPHLTDERFVLNPFDRIPGSRMYRTGDIARYLPDGDIKYIGRIDHQVKVRGFRIELGEIETVLSKYSGVKEAVVVANDNRLVGYVVAEQGEEVLPELREFLEGRLPGYMVPSAFAALDTIPLTPSGKVDRKRLPAPEKGLNKGTAGPRNQLEKAIVEIWAEILGVDEPGIYDNFFDLGGHSILATQVVSRIRHTCHIELPLRIFFERPTVEGLSEVIGNLEKEEVGIIPRRSEGDQLELSFAQERLWFLNQLIPDSPFYNMPMAGRLSGNLNVPVLEKTFSVIFRRHQVLRTNFVTKDGKPVPVIRPEHRFKLAIIDLTALSADECDERVRQLANENSMAIFDLTRDPLLRVTLLKLSQEEHVLLLTMHHIASDGWSTGILMREICTLYEAFLKDKSSPLPELEIQYGDFAFWQNRWLRGEILEKQLHYWKSHLAELPTLELPLDRPRPRPASYRGGIEYLEIPADITKRLRELGNHEGATLYMTLLTAFAILMSRYSGQEDVVLGSPIAGRNHKEIEPLIGFFANSLVMRCDLSGDPGFIEALLRIKKMAMDAFENQDLPFEQLVEELRPERDMSRNPLAQVIFALQNAPMSEVKLPELSLNSVEMENIMVRSDMEVHVWEIDEVINVQMLYSVDLFEQRTIQRMILNFRTLIDEITSDPFKKVSQFEIICPSERHQLLVQWNDTKREYPSGKCIYELFEQQVEKTPESIAVIFENKSLTYRELNEKANQLAHYLRDRYNVQLNHLIGIMLEPSVTSIIALMGILKSGGGYVPLDPLHPEERVTNMIEDSGMRLIIKKSAFKTSLENGKSETSAIKSCETVNIDAQWNEIRNNASTLNLEISTIHPDNIAYVIYTSGSTGRPKGVVIKNQSIVNTLFWSSEYYGFTKDDNALQILSLSFDASVAGVFVPLVSGSSLIMLARDRRLDPIYLKHLIESHRVTSFMVTPALYQTLLQEVGEYFRGLKHVTVGGESMSEQLVSKHFHLLPQVRLFNEYGPTENSVCSTVYEYTEDGKTTLSGRPIIGKPINNVGIYILDGNNGLSPIGVGGEICLSGSGLAAGYLNRVGQTQERFCSNPLKEGERMYQTGDLGRWLPDGNIEFLGRLDEQVKIRGYRIECGEIEAHLREESCVKEAVVISREDLPGEKRLAGYLTFEPDYKISSEDLSDQASNQVSSWEKTFDDTLSERSTEEVEDPLFITLGWDNSYDNSPIPREEMRVWRDDMVDGILELRPERVLEIGCGTGMLLFQIAPYCNEFIGTDFSSVSLEYVDKQIKSNAATYSNVKLLKREANDLLDLEENSMDCIILNSIVQYFPNIDYLLEVLTGCVRAVKPGGFIVLGDVRNYQLLRTFHIWVQAKKGVKSKEKRSESVEKEMARENELLVDPMLFPGLKQHFNEISHVQIRLQRGRHGNELNTFRYTAILHIEKHETRLIEPDIIDGRGIGLEVIREYVANMDSRYLCITGLLNERLEKQIQLEKSSEAEKGETGIDPEHIYRLGEELCYHVEVSWSPIDKGLMDVVFLKRDEMDKEVIVLTPITMKKLPIRSWNSYGNNPLISKIKPQLMEKIRDNLKRRVPEYMVPAAMVWIESLPLTSTEKIDHNALPMPELERMGDYTAPENEVQEYLAGLWSDLLGIKKVGINDNFFELGGHSLLATQLISKINSNFQSIVSLRDLFEAPTVSGLAQILANEKQAEVEKEDETTEKDEKHSGDLSNIKLEKSPSPYIKVERRPFLSLFACNKLAPVNSVSISCIMDHYLESTKLTKEEFLIKYTDYKPIFSHVVQCEQGRIGGITIPIFSHEIYEKKEFLIETLIDAIETAKSIGAKVVSLTGLIPSATDYGRSILSSPRYNKDLPKVTTGHATTISAVVLSIKKILRNSNRDITGECVGFLGLGSIGTATLFLMLKSLPHPYEIILCDTTNKINYMKQLKEKIVGEFGFKGNVGILESKLEVPLEFYDAGLIVGATNVPDILKIGTLKEGTLIVDDSGPHCFNLQDAINRFQNHGDILFTEGGVLEVPYPLHRTVYLPGDMEMSDDTHEDTHRQITGCVFSSLLSTLNRDLGLTIGAVDLNDGAEHYQKLVDSGFEAADLHCQEFILDRDKVRRFSEKFGLLKPGA
jgi:amino acid adenylation domain-containing protein